MTLIERVRAVLSSFYLSDYDLAAAENDAGAMTAAMKGFADLHALRFQPPSGDDVSDGELAKWKGEPGPVVVKHFNDPLAKDADALRRQQVNVPANSPPPGRR